jgi:hypothetical protein
MPSPGNATLDDLYRVEGKAHLIGGRIVRSIGVGELPATIAFEIAINLHGQVTVELPDLISRHHSASQLWTNWKNCCLR